MPNTPNVRVVTLETAIADINNRPRPFAVVNRDQRAGQEVEMAPLLERLPDGFTGDFLIALTTMTELNQADLPLGRHREQFLTGEPVMVEVQKLHETSERAQGGQDVVGLEERARDGLYVTVALTVEKMRACADCAERRKMDAVARRGEIMARLAPHLPGMSVINLFREGQNLVGAWHPGQTARAVIKSVYKSVAELPMGMVNLAAIEEEQIELARTAGAIYTKALSFLKAQHEMSAMIREVKISDEFKNATTVEQYDMQAKLLREKAPAQHQELAHDKQGGPSFAQFMRAAHSMDFNPAWVFLNVFAYKEELACAMLLGRAERGVGAMLEPTHIARLRHFMTLAEAADGHGKTANVEVAATQCLRNLALRVKPRTAWDEFFTVAVAAGGSLWVIKAP